MVGAEPLDQRAHQRGAHPRLRDQRGREQLADVAIDVADAVLRRDVREVAGPGDPPGALELGKRLRRIAADMAVGRVVDDEVELRPVLGSLPDIGDVGEAAQVGVLLLDCGREKSCCDRL